MTEPMTEPMTEQVNLDLDRRDRIGLGEAVLGDAKTPAQLDAVLDRAAASGTSVLVTRLAADRHAVLAAQHRAVVDYDEGSATAFFGPPPPVRGPAQVAVVTAGTSDARVAGEAVRTLAFAGRAALLVQDVGVAGLWRLQERLPEIAAHRVVIAVAGMDAALPTVLAGLVPGVVVGVPTSVGYGVAAGGTAALHALLASCAPGLVVVNVDNGYGAACAALRVLGGAR